MKEVIGLQYLRGIAAFVVVLYHIAPESWAQWDAFGYKTLAGGVDIFFVISGYIIWLTTQKAGVRPWPWWRTRLIRIVPLYWIGLLAALLMYALRDIEMPGPAELIKSFLFIPAKNSHEGGDQEVGGFAPILFPGWTLYYEFFFYATMALLLFLPQRMLRLFLLCVFFGTLVALRAVADKTDPIQFRYTSPLLFEFVAGIFIACTLEYMSGWRWRVRSAIGMASVVLAVMFLTLVSRRYLPDGPRVVKFGVPAALFVFGIVCLEDVIRRHVIRPLKFLGDASYSLYLSHPVVLPLGTWLFFDVLGLQGENARFFFRLLICLAVGIATYLLIERPLLHWMRGWGKAPPPPTRTAAAPVS